MTIRCSKCHKVFKTEVDLEVGQHVFCPLCGEKFFYLVDEDVKKPSSSDFDRVRYFDGRDEKPSIVKKVLKVILGVILGLMVIGIIGSCIEEKNAPTTATLQKTPTSATLQKALPFNRISWQWHSGGEGFAVYVINTDAPANAQLMATYVMGRLDDVQLVGSSDNQKGEAVRQLVKTLYGLEAELRAMGRSN